MLSSWNMNQVAKSALFYASRGSEFLQGKKKIVEFWKIKFVYFEEMLSLHFLSEINTNKRVSLLPQHAPLLFATVFFTIAIQTWRYITKYNLFFELALKSTQ